MSRYVLVITLLIQVIYGFSPNAQQKQRVVNFRPANFVSAAAPSSSTVPFVFLRMASDGEDSKAVESKISADGTFYDDELDSAPKKEGISDSMRAKLIAEASTGLDSNQKQSNVILYIIVGVAVLVALGGAGILY